jgi:alkanesulfonate monooxygenase SsuD/methylene tetrahydromethanopterin reductase-like flavin-dependent oxidoreductase (luciferase family)
VGRFAEYVEILDGILQGDGKPYRFDGRWYRASDVPTVPRPVQSPRPRLIVGGQAPTVLRVAADYGDVWNTHTAYGAGVAADATLDDVVERTRQQNRRLDELCEERGRDPKTLRRSGLLTATTAELVERFSEAGIEDFVFGWPPDEHLDEFEQVVHSLIAA